MAFAMRFRMMGFRRLGQRAYACARQRLATDRMQLCDARRIGAQDAAACGWLPRIRRRACATGFHGLGTIIVRSSMSPTRAAAQRTALLRAGYRAGRKERAAPIDWRNRPNQRSRQSPSIARFLGEKYPRAAEYCIAGQAAARYNRQRKCFYEEGLS